MIDQSSPPALAHGEALIVPAPEGVDAAISRVMARHQDELDAALEPFDVSLDDLVQATWMRFVRVGDVEALRSPGGGVNDSEASPEVAAAHEERMRAPAPDVDAAAIMALAQRGVRAPELTDDDVWAAAGRADRIERRGGCCGSGDACSSEACTGSPSAPAVDGVYVTDQLRDPESFGERIAPEPRNDAAVFGAPRAAEVGGCAGEACGSGCPVSGEQLRDGGVSLAEVQENERTRHGRRAPMYGGRDEDGI